MRQSRRTSRLNEWIQFESIQRKSTQGVDAAVVPRPEEIRDQRRPGLFRESLRVSDTNHVLDDIHHVPLYIGLLPVVAMALGAYIAWLFYVRRPELPDELARQHEPLYKFLLNKWYFDELYDIVFVRPALWIGRLLWKGGDGWLIDGFGPDGVSMRVLDVTRNVIRLQTGYLYHYAVAMLIGVAALITWFMFTGGAGP